MLFEAIIIELSTYMSVHKAAKFLKLCDMSVWRTILFHVAKARELEVYQDVTHLGIDDKSYQKGHKYVSVVVDLLKRKVICVVKGRDHNSLREFVQDFTAHGGVPSNIQITTCDMSIAFKHGIKHYFNNTKVIIDKFHVFKHMNDALNNVRRIESLDNKTLKRSRFLFLKSSENLDENKIIKRDLLLKLNPLTCMAYSAKIELEKIYNECNTKEEALERFSKLIDMLQKTNLKPLVELSATFLNNLNKISEYFDERYTNAILEGFNSRIQECKSRAKGFSNIE
jgi:transposase